MRIRAEEKNKVTTSWSTLNLYCECAPSFMSGSSKDTCVNTGKRLPTLTVFLTCHLRHGFMGSRKRVEHGDQASLALGSRSQ